MLVHRGDRVLLGHSQRFPNTTMYSTLAGFVEPGESLEEAVAREVLEEVGVRVGAVRYHSSQPWPFPASIMLGFYAEGLSDAITIQQDELRDARWFTRAGAARPGFARVPTAAPRQHRPPPDRGLDGARLMPIRPLILALVVLTAGACSSSPSSAPSSQEEACARQANDDPVVRDMLAKSAGSDEWQWHHAGDLRAARQDATVRCLRARGLAPKGGVERHRQ